MRRYKKILFSIFLCFVCLPLMALADPYEQKRQQAQQLVESGIAYLQTRTIEQARKAFHDERGPFIQGEFYLFVIDLSDKQLIHGQDPELEDINLSGVRDADGSYFVKKMTELAKFPGYGWVQYQWPNYTTRAHTVMLKESYVKRVPGQPLYVGSGFYHN